MARPRVRPLVSVQCAFCGAPLNRVVRTDRPNDNYFCNMAHRNKYKIGKSPGNLKYRNATLIDEYRRISDKLGRPALYTEIKTHSIIYPSIFQKRFHTLDNLRKLAYPEFDRNKNDGWDVNSVSLEDGGWLAGVCVGEACFRVSRTITKNKTQRFDTVFHIQLRADDAQILVEIMRIWNISKPLGLWKRDSDRKRGIDAGDGVVLSIRDSLTIFSRIVPTFDRFPMRGKKQKDFEIFKCAATILHNKRAEGRRNARLTDDERAELERLYFESKAVKKYKSELVDILNQCPSVMIG